MNMAFSIKIEGLNELQRKLEQMPTGIQRIRQEVLREYAIKIEKKAKESCPNG